MIALHTLNGVAALLFGLGIILLPKGTRLHRGIGYGYVVSMYLLCILSFGIRDTTPFIRGLGAFHVMALVSTASVTAGLLPVIRRPRPANWYDRHFGSMLWSYVGLVMAFGSHFFRPLFLTLRDLSGSQVVALATTIAVVWVLPLIAGRVLIPRTGRANRGLRAA
jgi:uncharacterized membrane protein